MNTDIIPFDDAHTVERGLKLIRTGAVIAFPTDTVYGVAVSAFDTAGIEVLFHVKGRGYDKAIAVLIGDWPQIHDVAAHIPDFAETLARHFWPGALTLVIPKKPGLPDNLSRTNTVGVRMPDHDLLRELIRRSGPLATTSANLSGQRNSVTGQDVLEQLGGKITAVLDGGQTAGAIPSTVVDCTGEKARILRHGKISEDALLQVLKSDLLPD